MNITKIAMRIAESEGWPIFELKGPFSEVPQKITGNYFELNTPEVQIIGKAFYDAMSQDLDPELLEKEPPTSMDMDWLNEYGILAEIDYSYDKPEKSVGYAGGYSIEKFKIIAIRSGVSEGKWYGLTPEDSKTIENALASHFDENYIYEVLQENEKNRDDGPGDF